VGGLGKCSGGQRDDNGNREDNGNECNEGNDEDIKYNINEVIEGNNFDNIEGNENE
jgi:hypothetical protein